MEITRIMVENWDNIILWDGEKKTWSKTRVSLKWNNDKISGKEGEQLAGSSLYSLVKIKPRFIKSN